VSNGFGWYNGSVDKVAVKPKGTGLLKFDKDGKGKPVDAFYDGSWFNGEFHGFGKYQTEDYYYEGLWSNGKENGYGKKCWTDGSVYEGWFRDGNRDGFGTVTWTVTARTFSGKWVDDDIGGDGIMLWPNGDYHKAFFSHYTPVKEGSMRESDGRGIVYEGDSYDEQRNGEGKLTERGGGVYIGDFVMGNKDGFGTYTSTRHIFEGHWKRNKKDGMFIVTNRITGEIKEQQLYIDDKLQH
jgi:hypothetical protein